MRGFSRIQNYLRHASTSKIVVASAFVMLLSVAVVGSLVASRQSVDAAGGDCSANSIIKCGTADANAFAAAYGQNAYGDLSAIFNHYGLASNEVERFRTTAKMGTAYKDGRIVVDGKVVATNASSLGRQNKRGDQPLTINGKTYYQGSNQTAFKSNALPALVMLDANGKFEFAVLTACANPITGTPEEPTPPPTPPTPPAPTAKCDALTQNTISRNQFSYNARASVSNGATISGYVFETRKDSNTGTVVNTATITSTSTTASSGTITLNDSGTYYTRVTVKTSVGDQTGNACIVKTTVAKPNEIQVCRDNKIITIPEDQRRDTDENVDSPKCRQIEVCRDGKTTTIYESDKKSTDLPVDAEECKPQTPVTEIPSTGPGEFIGAALGVSSMSGAGFYFFRSRRDLVDSILKR